MSQSMKHVQRGFGSVRPYLCGPTSLTTFIQSAFGAEFIEANEGGPTRLKLGDSLLWVEAGELPAHIKAWVGSVYVYVPKVDTVYARAMELVARSISEPEDKPYQRAPGRLCGCWWQHMVGKLIITTHQVRVRRCYVQVPLIHSESR